MTIIKKNFIWNLIGSTVNSFTSLFFLIIVTRINGQDIAGIFTFAFSYATLIQVIGNYAGRSYQVTELNKELLDKDFLYSKIITCSIMLISSLLFIIIKGYSLYKVIVIVLLVIFRMIEVIAEVLYAVIQKESKLYQVGISLFMKGLLALLLFLIIDFITNNLLLSIVGIIMINVLLLIVYDIKNVKQLKFKLVKIRKMAIKKILYSGFSVFAFTFLTQYVMNASKYAMDGLLSNKYQTIYGILIMPATLMLLCSTFVIQPFLVTLKENLNKNEIKKFSFLVLKLCTLLAILGFIALISCYFLGIPILEFVYGISLKLYRNSLLLIVLGATLFGIVYIISTSLVAMRRNFVQLIIYLIVSIFCLIVSPILIKKGSIYGASLSYLYSMIILLILYITYFTICIKEKRKNK